MSSKKKTTNAKVDVSDKRYRWRQFYDTYRITDKEAGRVVQFSYQGLKDESPPPITSVFIDWEAIRTQVEDSRDYIGGLGATETIIPLRPIYGKAHPPEFTNHIQMAHTHGIGEIRFNVISLHELAGAMRAEPDDNPITLKAIPAVMVHAPFDLHRQLILELFSLPT